MKKKLLLICQHYYPEMISTGLHMTELATALNNNFDDLEIEVLCSYPSKNMFKEEEISGNYRNVKIIRKRSNGKEHGGVMARLIFGASFFLRVISYLLFNQKRYRGFVITTNPPFLGLATVILKKVFKKPFFLIVYDVYPDIAIKMGILKKGSLTQRVWNFCAILILKNATAFSVIGRDMEQLLISKAKGLEDKSVLIYNWSDADHVKPIRTSENIFLHQYPSLQGKFLFVYSGNIGRTHNIEDILALAKEFETEKDCTFLLIGGGAKFKWLNEEAKKFNNVIVLPYQPFELLPHVLNASTFCLVCLDKNFSGYSVPSKAYGIMAAGKPIIAFLEESSEIGLTIREAQCGFVVEDNCSLNTLKQDILEAMETGASVGMGHNALKAFRENYTLTLAAEKYYNVFSKIF
jgi:glycosyltransferase involved in cell wall biosynthesis